MNVINVVKSSGLWDCLSFSLKSFAVTTAWSSCFQEILIFIYLAYQYLCSINLGFISRGIGLNVFFVLMGSTHWDLANGQES